MKNIILIFLFPICAMVSCAAQSVKVEIIKSPIAVTQKSSKLKTTAEREIKLPEKYFPKNSVCVKIKITPAIETSAVIFEEKVPDGWKISRAAPEWNKQYDNTYKWLIWGKQLNEVVKKIEIEYEIEILEKSEKTIKFEGMVKTFKEGKIPVKGDQGIKWNLKNEKRKN